MLKFKTVRSTFAYLSSNLLNEVGLYFEVGLRVCDIVVKKFTFAISSPDEFLYGMMQGVADEASKFTMYNVYLFSVLTSSLRLVWLCFSIYLLTSVHVLNRCFTVISRAHSFPQAAEFRAEPRNLAVAAEFPYFRGISRNSE